MDFNLIINIASGVVLGGIIFSFLKSFNKHFADNSDQDWGELTGWVIFGLIVLFILWLLSVFIK